jgi:hypothetical protein
MAIAFFQHFDVYFLVIFISFVVTFVYQFMDPPTNQTMTCSMPEEFIFVCIFMFASIL